MNASRSRRFILAADRSIEKPRLLLNRFSVSRFGKRGNDSGTNTNEIFCAHTLETDLNMKKHMPRNFRPALVLAFAVAGACVTISPQLQASEVQVGRYSVLRGLPTAAQADLLSTTITIRFPERIQTIGEAVRYLLQRSGYRLTDQHAVNSVTAGLLGLPLPAVHRNLGPITLQQALETLAGPVFRLVQDPVHRLIAFELCTPVTSAVHEPDSSLKTEDLQDGE